MIKTREVDEFGNVSYALTSEDGADAGRLSKTCSAWRLSLPSGDFVPVRSIKAGMEWFGFRDRILAMPKVTA
jgi:hypothetical protein